METQLEKNVTILFKDDSNNKAEITITVKQLLENSEDVFYEWLDNSESCSSSGCNNESQNFCDCGSAYEDFYIYGIKF